jgi:hypothetical protein
LTSGFASWYIYAKLCKLSWSDYKNPEHVYLPTGDGMISLMDARDIAAVSVQALANNNQHLEN